LNSLTIFYSTCSIQKNVTITKMYECAKHSVKPTEDRFFYDTIFTDISQIIIRKIQRVIDEMLLMRKHWNSIHTLIHKSQPEVSLLCFCWIISLISFSLSFKLRCRYVLLFSSVLIFSSDVFILLSRPSLMLLMLSRRNIRPTDSYILVSSGRLLISFVVSSARCFVRRNFSICISANFNFCLVSTIFSCSFEKACFNSSSNTFDILDYHSFLWVKLQNDILKIFKGKEAYIDCIWFLW